MITLSSKLSLFSFSSVKKFWSLQLPLLSKYHSTNASTSNTLNVHPFTFDQIIQLSDGSVIQTNTLSQSKSYIHLTLDSANHPSWQSRNGMGNKNLDESGSIAKFSKRFGLEWSTSSASSASLNTQNNNNIDTLNANNDKVTGANNANIDIANVSLNKAVSLMNDPFSSMMQSWSDVMTSSSSSNTATSKKEVNFPGKATSDSSKTPSKTAKKKK